MRRVSERLLEIRNNTSVGPLDFISTGACVVGLSLGMTIEAWVWIHVHHLQSFVVVCFLFMQLGSYVGSIWQFFYGWGLGFLCNLSWIQISSYIRSKLGLGLLGWWRYNTWWFVWFPNFLVFATMCVES